MPVLDTCKLKEIAIKTEDKVKYGHLSTQGKVTLELRQIVQYG